MYQVSDADEALQVSGFEVFSAISAYLCDLCVTVGAKKYLTQRSQRYAEIAEKNQLL